MQFDYIQEKIKNAVVNHKPWPYITIKNFLSEEHLQLLVNDWHSIDWKQHEIEKLELERNWEQPNWVREFYSKQESKLLIEYLSTKEIFNCVEDKFGVSVDWNDIKVKPLFKRDDPWAADESHTDVHCGVNSYMVIQIFFPDKSYNEFGTVLQEYYDQPFEESLELPLIRNSANIFINTPETWHVVKPGDRLRKSYIQRFVFKEGHEPSDWDHYKK